MRLPLMSPVGAAGAGAYGVGAAVDAFVLAVAVLVSSMGTAAAAAVGRGSAKFALFFVALVLVFAVWTP